MEQVANLVVSGFVDMGKPIFDFLLVDLANMILFAPGNVANGRIQISGTRSGS
jgi:hypothetical protein